MKYHNRKINYNGMVFDSVKELRRYKELELMVRAGAIRNLQRQVKFTLIPAQYEPDTFTKTGKPKKGKLIERACNYVADFVYVDTETDKTIVEDTKGYRTKDYIIKRKLMLTKGYRIREI